MKGKMRRQELTRGPSNLKAWWREEQGTVARQPSSGLPSSQGWRISSKAPLFFLNNQLLPLQLAAPQNHCLPQSHDEDSLALLQNSWWEIDKEPSAVLESNLTFWKRPVSCSCQERGP